MKTKYNTLWELFDDLSTEYKVEIPLITGGIGYGEHRRFSFDIGKKKAMLQVQIWRLDSGLYEYNGYVL